MSNLYWNNETWFFLFWRKQNERRNNSNRQSKGSVGKSFSCINIGVGLAREWKKVLLVDFDPQASIIIALGYPQPDQLPVTVTDVMTKVIEDEPFQRNEGIFTAQKVLIYCPQAFDYQTWKLLW